MNRIYFYVPGVPQGKARARTVRAVNGSVHTYTPQKTSAYEALIRICYGKKYSGLSFKPDEPLKMHIVAYMPIPKASRRKTELMRSQKLRPTKKPDWDNIAKVIGDALNQTAYPDDKQIVAAEIHKLFSDTPGVSVEIESLEEKNNA